MCIRDREGPARDACSGNPKQARLGMLTLYSSDVPAVLLTEYGLARQRSFSFRERSSAFAVLPEPLLHIFVDLAAVKAEVRQNMIELLFVFALEKFQIGVLQHTVHIVVADGGVKIDGMFHVIQVFSAHRCV